VNGHEYRFDVAAELLPGRREGLVGPGSMQLVTLRLFNGPGVVDEHGQPSRAPDAFTDLRPSQARLLADQLLDCARRAEALRRETD
jgi:hypothetical protein